MNPPDSNTEPRWMTYLKTAAWGLPALTVWIFNCVLVIPKLKEVCAASDTAFPTPILMTLTVSEFFKNNLLAGLAIVVPVLVLLEWRSRQWPRYRRMVFGLATYLLNLAVLAGLTALGVLAVIAGANLLPQK
jgi:type II secretory pathway component PulF